MMITADGRTPPLPAAKAAYLRRGMTDIKGWLNPSTATYLSSLELLQRHGGVSGDVCEIGIHHGLSFLCLALGLPAGQRAVAIDLFDQAGNVDGSGRGDRSIFERNLARHGADLGAIDVIQASSLELDRLGFLDQGRRFRIFSIDGGHTAEITHNDLLAAERTVVDGGLVILDDVLNRHWLGVITGLFRYWSKGGTLVPAVLVPNKLILAPSPDTAAAGRALMETHFRRAREKRGVPLGDHEIDVYGEYPWTVVDDRGGTGLLATMKLPLRRRLAARMPRVARRARQVRNRLRRR